MKSGRILSIIAVGLLVSAGCSSSNDSGGSAGSGGGGVTGGSSGTGGSTAGTGGVAGTTGGGGSSGTGGVAGTTGGGAGVTGGGGSSGTGGVAGTTGGGGGAGATGGGGSAGAGGSTLTPGNEGDDCTTVPCALPWACCPSDNTCTPADFKICSMPVMVQCTKTSDCTGGKLCCVTAASTTGSGPSGSECRDSCTGLQDGGLGEYQGIACNTGPIGGKTADCPAPASQWTSCVRVSNSPAGLGLCTK